MTLQLTSFKRLLLVSSIGLASFSLVACGDSDKPSPFDVVKSDEKPSGQTPDTSAAKYYLAAYKGDTTPTTAVTWTASDGDERIRKLKVDGDDLIVLNRWYNGITKVPTSSADKTVTPVGFASLRTSHEHKLSSDEDFISGASEHLLLDAWYANDDSAMYALVNKPESTVAADDTYGLFKVPLSADGSVPSTQVKGKAVYHRGTGVVRVGAGTTDNDLNLKAALPLADGRILAFDDNHDAVAVFSSNLALDEGNSFSVANKEIEAWVANADGAYLLVKDSNNKVMLEKRALDSIKTVTKSVSVENGYLAGHKNSEHIAIASGNQLHLFDKNLTLLQTFSLPNKASGLSLSQDGERLAVKTSADGELVLVDIKKATPAVTTVTLKDEFGYFTMADKNTLFVTLKRTGEVKKINLTAEPVALTAEELLAKALESVSAESVNHELAASAVRFDLDLPTNEAGGLPNVAYEWSSNKDSVINAQTGKVTQPAIGAAAVPVALTLKATATVGGVTKTGNKTLNLTVLPKVASKSFSNSLALPSAITDKYSFRTVAANADASKIALFADDHHGSSDKFAILLVDNNAGSLSSNNQLIKLPEPYNKQWIRGLVWQDNNTLIVFAAGDRDEKNPMAGAIFKVDATSKAVSKVADTDAYIRSSIAFSKDNSIGNVLLMSKNDAGKDVYKLVTYNISDLSKTAEYDFPTRLRAYTTDTTGKIVYSYSGNKLIRYYQGVKDAEIKAEGISSFYYPELYADKVLAGDRNGNFAVLANATAATAPTTNDLTVTVTGRGGYNGSAVTNRYQGRMYSIAGMGDKVITSYRGVGLSVYEKTASGYQEQAFVADSSVYRFAPVGNDGQFLVVPLKGSGGKVNLLNLK